MSKGDLKLELTKEEEERCTLRPVLASPHCLAASRSVERAGIYVVARLEELEKSGGRRTLVRRATQWRVGEQEEEHTINKDSSASGSETPKTPKVRISF